METDRPRTSIEVFAEPGTRRSLLTRALLGILSRALQSGGSWRTLSRPIGGLALGGPPAFLTADAGAKKRKKRKRRKRRKPQGPCTVCAAGCRHRSIRAAVAAARNGATITVAPGVYEEVDPENRGRGLVVDKNVTIRRCGASGDVVLRNSDPGQYMASLSVPWYGFPFKVTVEDLVFTRNPTLQYGGKIVTWGDLTLVNCTVTECISQPHVTAGGIHNGGALTMRGGAVTANRAPFGAGIYNEGSLASVNPDAGRVTLVGTEVSRNVATSSGAGIDSEDQRTVLSLTDCAVNDNTSDSGGAGVSNSGAATLVRTAVSGNTSKYGYGGGIATNGPMTLVDCAVTGNSAGESGGGIYSAHTVTLLGTTTIAGNTPNNCDGTVPVEGCEG